MWFDDGHFGRHLELDILFICTHLLMRNEMRFFISYRIYRIKNALGFVSLISRMKILIRIIRIHHMRRLRKGKKLWEIFNFPEFWNMWTAKKVFPCINSDNKITERRLTYAASLTSNEWVENFDLWAVIKHFRKFSQVSVCVMFVRRTTFIHVIL